MEESKLRKANSLSSAIYSLKQWRDVANEKPVWWTSLSKQPRHIEHPELSRKISALIIEFANSEIPKLEKEFSEL